MNQIKITEIKEPYTVNRKEKDSNGETIIVLKTFLRFVEVPYVQGWARFGHFLLDRVFFYIFTLIIGLGIGIILGLTNNMEFVESSSFEFLLDVFSYLFLYPLYYFIFEASMQSTPGKLILGRIVVDEYGEKPSVSQILGRSFARIVPFEVLSCLGEMGWHDKWSHTFVIRKKDLAGLKALAQIQNFDAPEQDVPTNKNEPVNITPSI